MSSSVEAHTTRRRLGRRSGAGILVAVALVFASFDSTSTARAAANDPISSNVWGINFVGGYYFHDADFTLGWMRSAVNRANATIGHQSTRNPDFHATTSTTANGAVHCMSSSTNACDNVYGWKACADAYTNQTFRLWFASNFCWTDGASSTCGGTQYDVETVALNEMGHVNRLQHHVNPAYGDAVVQVNVYPYSDPTYGRNRALRWADTGALRTLYGVDCTTPPCPLGGDL